MVWWEMARAEGMRLRKRLRLHINIHKNRDWGFLFLPTVAWAQLSSSSFQMAYIPVSTMNADFLTGLVSPLMLLCCYCCTKCCLYGYTFIQPYGIWICFICMLFLARFSFVCCSLLVCSEMWKAAPGWGVLIYISFCFYSSVCSHVSYEYKS